MAALKKEEKKQQDKLADAEKKQQELQAKADAKDSEKKAAAAAVAAQKVRAARGSLLHVPDVRASTGGSPRNAIVPDRRTHRCRSLSPSSPPKSNRRRRN